MKNVAAAILVKDNRILIAKRSAKDKFANKWEFPGGKIEEGETPEECLKRELKEELDIEVVIGDFFAESNYPYENGVINLLTFWTCWVGREIKLLEHAEYRWVAVSELVNYDFLPADIPLINKLAKVEIPLLQYSF